MQIAYAIGVAKPVSMMVETFGTERCGREQIESLIDRHFDLRPGAIRETLALQRPIYSPTAVYGHFGREDPGFTGYNTDRAQLFDGRLDSCATSRPSRPEAAVPGERRPPEKVSGDRS